MKMKEWKERERAEVRYCEAKELLEAKKERREDEERWMEVFGFLRTGDRILKLVVLFEA